MKIKRLKSIKVHATTFRIEWNKKNVGGSFSYRAKILSIGTKGDEIQVFANLCHELQELAAIEMHVRLDRPDCGGDYIFVYDHRQFDTMSEMFSDLLARFIV